ncbi:ABC transporter ATP-binding protein [Aerococcaceae bacterium DSM 111022]|nr:ABC transporter ATP-binding protein [Aerococcaceae bacterium DSM 111022]
MSPYKVRFILAMLATVVAMVANAIEPFIFGLAITELSNNVVEIIQGVPGAGVNFEYIGQVLILYFFRGLSYILGTYFSNVLMAEVVQSSIYDLRSDLGNKVHKLPVSYFDSEETGDILAKMTNDVDAMANAMQQTFIQVVNGILGITFALIMMFLINWKIALIVVVMIPVSAGVAAWMSKKSQPAFHLQSDSLGHLFGFTQEQLSGFTEIKVYGKQDESVDEFIARNEKLREHGFKASFLSSMMMPLMVLISNSTYVIAAVVGTFQVFAGSLSVGNLQAVVQYVSQINQPVQTLAQLTGMVQAALAAGNRVFTLLDEPEEEQREVTGTLPAKVNGAVEFENVRFGYDKENPLMKDISFSVNPGDMIAVVGPTGAGKTTLINLLMRFYDIDSGSIKIDGVDTKDISRHELRKHFGMVLQDAWLYTDSIMENIRFGDLDATDLDVRRAAQTANVDHFIKTLPNGYQMEINEEANNVSLGQKQLMTIARAIIADPDILILDEATSSVDTRLEKLIQSAMDKVMEGRTSFVIAHRLSTIKNADKILVMDQGNIIEHGTHDELLAAGGFYADLYNSQFNEDTPAEINMAY